MKFYYVLAFAFVLQFSSCKKDDDATPAPQPPITAENTFSCKINGELFIPMDFASFPNNFNGYNVGFPTDDNSWFSRFRNENMNLYIYIYIYTKYYRKGFVFS